MSGRLIYDVGMHRGEDTDFYLKRGHRVVGVEANPNLVVELKARFRSEIGSGQLRIIDKAVDKVIAEAKHLTGDLGGKSSTTEMGDAIVAAM